MYKEEVKGLQYSVQKRDEKILEMNEE